MASVPIALRVVMGGHDVTRWVTSVTWRQSPRQLHREWAVTLTGWTQVDRTMRWDIAAGYGGGHELVIRQGIIPPDWQPSLSIGPRDRGPTLSIRGVDWAWVAARVRRSDTIVLAPDGRQARRALRIFQERAPGRPAGAVTTLRATTMHEAVVRLGTLAGMHVVALVPDYKIQGYVCDPERSIWESIWALVSPFAPLAYFRRERNEVVIADRAHAVGAATRMALPVSVITAAEIAPIREPNLRRVLVRIPAWVDSEARR